MGVFCCCEEEDGDGDDWDEDWEGEDDWEGDEDDREEEEDVEDAGECLQTVLQPGVLGSMLEGMAKVAEGSKSSSSSSLSWVEMPSSTSRIIASI